MRYFSTITGAGIRRSLLGKTVGYEAQRCIHNQYPCTSHQPVTFCLASWLLLILIAAFISYTLKCKIIQIFILQSLNIAKL